jgi:hypothetical protein
MQKQFLLIVDNHRGFPVFDLRAVVNNYDALNDSNVQGSLGSGSSLNLSLQEPNGTPFTLTATE